MKSLQVAVIGAGAAGLVAARELIRAGHRPTVFEASQSVGGLWVFDENTDSDPAGKATENTVFSSLYASLRTNLPRDLMAFRDYPFDSQGGGQDTWPRFPHHSQVRIYLENFCRDFNLQPAIRFDHKVLAVRDNKTHGPARWTLEVCAGDQIKPFDFDALMVCNGHYAQPRLPTLPGCRHFTGVQVHSHNYRAPDPYRQKRVLIWGAAASGTDIGLEIAAVAKHVYWCGDALTAQPRQPHLPDNLSLHPDIIGVDSSGRICLADGECLATVDVLLYCTGYETRFPFLPKDCIQVTDNWVHPLYQQLIPVGDPDIAFIGLPFLIVPFPLFEMQARWYARLLAGQFALPTESERQTSHDGEIQQLRQAGLKTRHFHRLGDQQLAYINQLARQCGEPELPADFAQLAQAAQRARQADPANYRDKPLELSSIPGQRQYQYKNANIRVPTRVPKTMQPTIEGSVADGFEPVADAFASLWRGIEVGASVCAFYQGRKVVDLWGGYTDADATQAWQQNTLVNVYSVTKGMAALLVGCLADDGLIDYEKPVSHYWPEFGAAGKQAITVAQLLSHQAGVYRFDAHLKVTDLYDAPRMANLVAAMTPHWSPGQGVGYHALTWGFAVNELVRRVTGQSAARLFRDRIAGPLQAEFYIGLPTELQACCAPLIGPNRARRPATQPAVSRPVPAYPDSPVNPLIRPFKDASSRAWREAEILSSNGQANARGIATVYAAVIDEERPLLSPAGLAAATHTEVATSLDWVLAKPMHYCRGFMGNSTGQFGPGSKAFGHDGVGGATGFADPEQNIAVGYAMNQMTNDHVNTPRALTLTRALYACIDMI